LNRSLQSTDVKITGLLARGNGVYIDSMLFNVGMVEIVSDEKLRVDHWNVAFFSHGYFSV
jgi:hypothetical protein